MTRVCSCSNEDCIRNGCLLDRPTSKTNWPFSVPTGAAPLPRPGQTVEFRPLTENDIRKIVREEIQKAKNESS